MSNPLGVRIVNAGDRDGLAVIDYTDRPGIRVRWYRRPSGQRIFRCTECGPNLPEACNHIHAVRLARQAHQRLTG